MTEPTMPTSPTSPPPPIASNQAGGAGTPEAGPAEQPTNAGARLRRMVGRDPNERSRVSSPLELLFDLTFVIAVGNAADQLAELTAHGHPAAAIAGFAFVMVAIWIAWMNFAWFASGFDTDDWAYRLCTMVQMVGVVIFAIGIEPFFHSLTEGGHHLDLRTMVAGYVVMRVAMALQWARAARQSPRYRRVCLTYLWTIVIAQTGWVIVAVSDIPLPWLLILMIPLGALEMASPMVAQGGAGGTPWHPEHIADRYAAFAIITLGEGVVGAVASSTGAFGGEGTHWTASAVTVLVAGIALTFSMWWVYFSVPFDKILELRRHSGYLFGYGHVIVFAAIAATGAGLHLTGLYLQHESQADELQTVVMVAIPVGVYVLSIFALHTVLTGIFDALHLIILVATVLVLVAAVILATASVSVSICLLVVAAAPAVSVVVYETVGVGHQREILTALQRAG